MRRAGENGSPPPSSRWKPLDRLVKRWLGDFRSSHVLVGVFVLLMLVTTVATSWLLYTNGVRTTRAVLVEVDARIRDEVREELLHFLHAPDRINAYTTHAIDAGRVASDATDALHRLFWDAPREENGIVSAIYLGSVGGSFIGLDSTDSAWPPTSWVYTAASASSGGARVYMPVDDRGHISGTPRIGGSYDPRVRPWFIAALDSDGPVWTDIYANFGDGVPTLTRAVALRDDAGEVIGVAGVDLFLEHLKHFLHRLDLGASGEVFLVEPDGTLLGASTGSGKTAPDGEDLVPIASSELRFTRAAGRYLSEVSDDHAAPAGGFTSSVVLDGVRGWLSLSPVGRRQGLDWSLGVFVPEHDYLEPVAAQLRRVLPLALLTLLIAFGTFAMFAALIVRPLRQLKNGASRIAVGEFDVPIDTGCGNEVGDLARAIDDMRDRLRRSFDVLREQRLTAETTLASIADGVVTVTPEGTVRYMNPVAERLTGVPLAQALGQNVEAVFRARDERTALPLTRTLILRSIADAHAIGQAVVVTGADGREHLVHCRISPVVRRDDIDVEGSKAAGAGTAARRLSAGATDDAPPMVNGAYGAVLNFSDLSEELRLKSELVHHATYDALTDLVNRREFERRLTRAVESARRRTSEHALCYVDLDRFKLVNDGAGHAAGDELLRQVARLLDGAVRGGDTVGRLGGDEFGLLLENCTLERATRVVETLRERVEGFRFVWEGRGHGIGISAGLVAIGPDSGSSVTVLRDADSACYIAKRAGRNRSHVHSDDDDALQRLRGERSWIERIERAFEENRFSLHAQRIEAADPEAAPHRHVEILLRLVDETGAPVSPAEFLPVAERYGLGARVDRWVVSHALDWLASLPPTGARPELCSINLSGQSLGDDTIEAHIVAEIRRSGVAPSSLCFEVTETATIANLSSALGLIGTLRALGCAFALDDFGSGLSSFAYLKTLPVDYLKIDGVFVRDMLDDPLDRAMVRSINEVGQTVGMRTIAEYVETDAIREALAEIGVDYVQGYGIGRPEPLDAVAFPEARLSSSAANEG